MCAKFESIRRRTVKWTTVYFEHLVDLMFLNTYVIANYWYTKEREEELKTEGKWNENSTVYNLNRHVFQRTLGSLLIKPWSDKTELNKSNAVYNTLGFKSSKHGSSSLFSSQSQLFQILKAKRIQNRRCAVCRFLGIKPKRTRRTCPVCFQYVCTMHRLYFGSLKCYKCCRFKKEEMKKLDEEYMEYRKEIKEDRNKKDGKLTEPRTKNPKLPKETKGSKLSSGNRSKSKSSSQGSKKKKVDSNENQEGSYVVRSSIGDRSKEGNEAVVGRFSYGYKQTDERNKPKQTNNWSVPICDRNKSSQDDGLPPIS